VANRRSRSAITRGCGGRPKGGRRVPRDDRSGRRAARRLGADAESPRHRLMFSDAEDFCRRLAARSATGTPARSSGHECRHSGQRGRSGHHATSGDEAAGEPCDAFHLSQAALPRCATRGSGRIVKSAPSRRHGTRPVDYATARRASSASLTPPCASRCAEAVHHHRQLWDPRAVSTRALLRHDADVSRIWSNARFPGGSLRAPRELAHVVVSLLHYEAAYVTGASGRRRRGPSAGR